MASKVLGPLLAVALAVALAVVFNRLQSTTPDEELAHERVHFELADRQAAVGRARASGGRGRSAAGQRGDGAAEKQPLRLPCGQGKAQHGWAAKASPPPSFPLLPSPAQVGRLAKVLSFPTVWAADPEQADPQPFKELHYYLLSAFPTVYEALKVERVRGNICVKIKSVDFRSWFHSCPECLSARRPGGGGGEGGGRGRVWELLAARGCCIGSLCALTGDGREANS